MFLKDKSLINKHVVKSIVFFLFSILPFETARKIGKAKLSSYSNIFFE